MKVVRWIAMFTGVTLLWTTLIVGGMLLWNDLSTPSRVEAEPPLATQEFRPVELPAPCCTEVEVPPPPSTELPVVHGHVRRVEGTHTLVQEQPSSYEACFGEATQARFTCRRLFNRTISEADLMHRFRATTPELSGVTRLVLGRIILSEVNWPHHERLDHANPDDNHAEVDAPLIYQVLRHTRNRGETLLGAMRRHAPHVSEARAVPPGHARMVWVTELQLDCNRPSHFETHDRNGNPLDWDRDYRPRCEALFALAQSLLDGDADAVGPWTHAPLVTWGGRCETEEGACDDENGWARGLVPFETGGTANRFWCRPGVDRCPAPETAEAQTEEVDEVGPVASEVELVSPAT